MKCSCTSLATCTTTIALEVLDKIPCSQQCIPSLGNMQGTCGESDQ